MVSDTLNELEKGGTASILMTCPKLVWLVEYAAYSTSITSCTSLALNLKQKGATKAVMKLMLQVETTMTSLFRVTKKIRSTSRQHRWIIRQHRKLKNLRRKRPTKMMKLARRNMKTLKNNLNII